MTALGLFGGPYKRQAVEAHATGVAEGWKGFGPAIYGELMSWGRNPWLFQANIARRVGCCVRTVQRWLAFFRDEGLLRCWRGSNRETPPGARGPVTCGFSNRALTAWHAVGERFRELVAQYKAERARKADERKARRARRWTADEIDAELERRSRAGPGKDN